ncbi:hypothetical protein JCM3774_003210 [Rhodotorula dairenensis]
MTCSPGRRFTLVYAALAALRVLVAITSTSVIHPDEHFQNPEIAADAVFRYEMGPGGSGPLRTWEWRGPTPARSIVPVFGSTGIAFWLVRLLCGTHPSGPVLFAAERGAMLLLSFCIDWLVWRTSLAHRPTQLLFATSPITFTYLLRPFSNSLETLCLALLLCLTRTSNRSGTTKAAAALMGAIVAYGCFVRVTFVAFALPACVHVLKPVRIFQQRSSRYAFMRSVSMMMVGAASTSLLCIAIDSWYFRGGAPWPVLAPLNLLRYNLSSANLKDHGLHPRYLHLLVNWPMLFGVGIAAVGSVARSGWRQRRARRDRLQSTAPPLFLATLVLPTLALSIQPHQEPRFLIPLLVPLVLIAGRSSLVSTENVLSRNRRVFWGFWLAHSVLFTALFGFLHQGGIIPALFQLNSDLRATSPGHLGALQEIDIVFWRTFMPPRHLLLPIPSGETAQPTVHVTDLAGADRPELYEALERLSSYLPASAEQSTTGRRGVLLVAPASSPGLAELACGPEQFAAVAGDFQPRSVCINPLWPEAPLFGVHVDMDRLDQLVRGGVERSGVGVWEVKAATDRLHARALGHDEIR